MSRETLSLKANSFGKVSSERGQPTQGIISVIKITNKMT